jgi:hypothetical protein
LIAISILSASTVIEVVSCSIAFILSASALLGLFRGGLVSLYHRTPWLKREGW